MSDISRPKPSYTKDITTVKASAVSPLPSFTDVDLEKGSTPPFQPKHAPTGSWVSGDSVLEEKISLPAKNQGRLLRHARHTFLNVYRRLFSIVFLLNLIGVWIVFARYKGASSPVFLAHLATAASANIMVALLVRQDYVVNTLFKIAWSIPLSAPLRIRRMFAKVYENGGVHSGAAVSSVVWFVIFTAYLTNDFVNSTTTDPAIMALTWILLVLLLSICITAYPKFRFKSHNTFENIHRWAGWFSLALFWAELVLFSRLQVGSNSKKLMLALIKLPAFWFLLISSLHAIYPWLRFHKLYVVPEKLSNHAIRLHFTEKIPLFVGLRISDAPLREWHSFACIPARDGNGGSVLISNAGDWTKKTIQNPKSYYWVKGVPVTGVLCMARVFRKIICVTTGSGIGPCLGVVQDIPIRGTACRVIWSTPNPLRTYGSEIVDAVHDVDPEALIIDTKKEGRPDLVSLAYELYKKENAEAVFIISNPTLTRKVVYGLESRGVPAFGPVWDS